MHSLYYNMYTLYIYINCPRKYYWCYQYAKLFKHFLYYSPWFKRSSNFKIEKVFALSLLPSFFIGFLDWFIACFKCCSLYFNNYNRQNCTFLHSFRGSINNYLSPLIVKNSNNYSKIWKSNNYKEDNPE